MARKILLADDSVTAQNMGRKILADAGYEVITVNNGSAALKKIGEQKPELIVLDVYMPGYSGLEVCQRLKEVAETARIPVLLTVGKLEPFKPEEAKRVRADAYIVKPFEASELLSALSKLEDKIVPRAESSKPGRLARATAAIDEGRHDKTMAVEEDSGWKNRISFPSKKKQTAADADADEAAIYNPVNKDLRTVVDHNPSEKANEKERVDLGALAPEGLPKDVTPEEIAALAAAAAQVKIAEEQAADSGERSSVAAHAAEKRDEALPKAEAVPEAPATATVAQPIELEKPEEKNADTVVAESPEAATAAIASSEQAPEATHAVSSSSISGPPEGRADEPVTMAMAGAATSGGAALPRWTAVSVALAPEDSAVSLEEEMQKAYASFAPTETAPSTPAPVVSEPESAPTAVAEPVPPVEAAVTETSASETETLSTAVTGVVPEAASALVQEDTAIAQPVAQESATPTASFSPVPSEAPTFASASTQVADEAPELNPAAIVSPSPETVQAEAAAPEVAHEDREPVEATSDAVVKDFAVVAPASEIPVAQSEERPVSSETAAEVPAEPAEESTRKPEKESDIAATTAAAWASWRRVRESGDSHGSNSTEPSHGDISAAKEAAAMAVAAGAESSPEEAASDESDPAIATIVDSVLADLRPRIVEEISRKLGKKK